MKPRHVTLFVLAALAAGSAHAGTFDWTNTNGGSWGTSGNWDSTPTFAANDILDFSTLDITSNAVTTLDGDRTAGALKFGDATTVSNNWTVNAGSGGTLTLSTTTGNATITTVASGDTVTLNIPIAGAGTQTIQKTGAGTLNLTGENTFTGLFSTDTSANSIINVSGDQSAATGGWKIDGNATVNFQAGSTIKVASGKSIQLVNTASVHTLNAAGTVTADGSLAVNAGGVLNINSGATWTQNGGMTIQPLQSYKTPVMNVNTGGSFTYTGTTAISLSSSVKTNGGSATLNLSGGTFTTGKNFNNSTVDGDGSTTATGSAGSANLTFSNGGTLKLSADITSLATTVTGGRPFNVQLGTGGGVIDTNGHSTAIALGIANVSGQTGSLTKKGAGTLTLSGANTFTGDKIADRGVVTVLGNQTAATGSWILRGGDTGSTYNTAAATVTFDSDSTLAVASGKTIQLGNATFSGGFALQTLDAIGAVTNDGTLFVGRSGRLNVSGAWTQNGAATVASQGGGTAAMKVLSGGSFTYASATQFVLTNDTATDLTIDGGSFTTGVKVHNNNATTGGTFSNVILSNGGALKLSADIADLITTAGANIRLSAGSGGGIVDTNGFSTTLNVPVNGTGGLTKQGAGSLTLTGTNDYTGTTSVTGGTLLINGANTGTGTASVSTGATLGGTGSIVGAVNVTGVLSPGASIESLSSGALTMTTGSTFHFEASDAGSSGADLMVVNGDLSLSGVTLDLSAANLDLASWGLGDKLTLLSYTGNGITGGFTGFADESNHTFGSNIWQIDYNDSSNGNNFGSEATGTSFVTLTVVPEPATAFLGSLCLLGVLRHRRN